MYPLTCRRMCFVRNSIHGTAYVNIAIATNFHVMSHEHSLWQVGTGSDHSPLSWHRREGLPTSSYPVVQVKLTVSPKEEPKTLTLPLGGAVSGVQVTTAGWKEGSIRTSRKTASHWGELLTVA